MTAQPGFAPHGQNGVTVQVTAYQDQCLKGVLNGQLLDGPTAFQSAIDLLSQLETAMDRARLPQRNEEPRTFQSAQAPARLPHVQTGNAESVLATFRLQVMFRQNATWQGRLLWVERDLEAHFRSVLELLELMDNALAAREEASL